MAQFQFSVDLTTPNGLGAADTRVAVFEGKRLISCASVHSPVSDPQSNGSVFENSKL
jgi:hypothetical protein